jgi:hypothetical protein
MGSVPLPEGITLRSDEEHVIWGQFTRARAREDWRDMDLLLLAKVVRMEADSDRPVKSLWRTRSSAITTRLSRRAQRQQGRVRQTLTLGRASVEFLSGIVGEDRQDAGRGDC